MSEPGGVSRSEVRRILEAAADVVFSDGVSDAFLDDWAAETCFLIDVRAATPGEPVPVPAPPAAVAPVRTTRRRRG